MPKPNANRLPEHLRHQDGRYILDFMVTLENGIRCRRIEKLPQGTVQGNREQALLPPEGHLHPGG